MSIVWGRALTLCGINVAVSHVKCFYDELHAIKVGESKDLSELGVMGCSDAICKLVLLDGTALVSRTDYIRLASWSCR